MQNGNSILIKFNSELEFMALIGALQSSGFEAGKKFQITDYNYKYNALTLTGKRMTTIMKNYKKALLKHIQNRWDATKHFLYLGMNLDKKIYWLSTQKYDNSEIFIDTFCAINLITSLKHYEDQA